MTGLGGAVQMDAVYDVGQVVEILQPSAALAESPEAEPVAVDGQKGQIVDWDGESQYVVVTFDGAAVLVDRDKVKVYEPLLPEEGGFDLVFPASDASREAFQVELIDVLLKQHYCVLQMTSQPSERLLAAQEAAERGKWVRMVPEFESEYMGLAPGGKKVSWSDGDEDLAVKEGLGAAGSALIQLSLAIIPFTPSFGFSGFGRSNTMLHMASQPDEENYLVSIARTESKVVDSKEIQDHLAFVHRRKFCMIYFVHGSGGSLTLIPRGAVGEKVKLECKENHIVVFRNDFFEFSFVGSGEPNQLALQAWVMREALEGELGMESDAIRPDAKTFDELEQIPKGPDYATSDEAVDVMSLGLRIPGQSWFPEGYWGMLATACDAIVLVPQMRWDLDVYYSAEQSPGKGYIKHFGMMDTTQMSTFDNEFFGMTPTEAANSDPPARNIMEVGYEALYRACWNKEKLRGIEMVVSYGYADSEFSNLALRGGHHGILETTRSDLACATCAARMHYVFGMRGPCSTTETACSSSLSATALMHAWMRPELPEFKQAAFRKQIKFGLASGSNGHFDPFYTISLCGASMLTHGGRCFTFDQSADGFVRGEGCAVMHYKVSYGEDLSRLAMLCGTCMNQDGRSASLTAPHGPSQQECIRHSLREAQISSLDIQIQELHGTGTALGDPIEVGALRATMMTHLGIVREHPLVKTSSKSNIGHTEMCAGILGIMKCVLMGMQCSSAPNIHLRLLNPHIDSNAYPVYFSSEFVDQGRDTGYHGVSSFGFGGSNARGDIWARAMAGPRNTNPGKPSWDLTFRRILKTADLFSASVVKPGRASPLAVENWQDLTGDFLTGDPFEGSNAFYFQCTYDGYTSMERMHYLEDKGGHVYAFCMGDALIEQFQIVCNRFEDAVVFPVTKMADENAIVLGPGEAPEGFRWAIDGRESAQEGAVCMVIFSWDPELKRKKVKWEMTQDERAVGLAMSRPKYKRNYIVLGSWNNFQPFKAKRADGAYMFEFRIGLTGHEEFNFLRDGDKHQVIYPARDRSLTRDVPVRGPDHFGEGKRWSVIGETGERVHVQLKVKEGELTVSIDQESQGMKTFKSLAGAQRRRYFVYSQWTNWGFTPMEPDSQNPTSIKRLTMTMPAEGVQSFQIVVDEDVHQALHPELEFADQLMSCAQGPDAKGPGLCWAISAHPGSRVEIKLNLSVLDTRETVTWRVVSKPQALDEN
uniref:Type I polyketide synthase n=1 Tax=Gambierdiscus excentricus TaxID=986170 RepID=A0A1S6K877_9DINO|nr:type I polyketide synthase [Gambierdiscus excentricus]